MYLTITLRRDILITHCNFIDCKPNRRSTRAPSSCTDSLAHNILNPTRALLEMRITIAILNISRSGPGKSLTLVGYISVFPKNK